MFSVVEGETIERGHVPAAAARAAFRPLLNELLRTFAPGQEIELYPRAMFYFVVKEVASGHRQGDLGDQLRRAHLDGSLQSRGGG